MKETNGGDMTKGLILLIFATMRLNIEVFDNIYMKSNFNKHNFPTMYVQYNLSF